MRPDRSLAFLLLAVVATVAVAADPANFARSYPLETPPGGSAYLVELPQDAYAWASPAAGLADVIVVDADQRPVAMGPYVPAAAATHAVTIRAPLLAVPQLAVGVAGARIQRNANGDIVIEPGTAAAAGTPREWLFDARAAVQPTRLEFAPSNRDMNLSVDVDASDDLQAWTPVARGAAVMSLGHGESGVDARVVKLDGPPMRYYRVRVVQGEAPWDAGGASTVSLSGTVVAASAADEAALQWTDAQPVGSKASGQGVDYDYELPAALPVGSIRASLGRGDNVARLEITALRGVAGDEPLGSIVLTPDQATDTESRVPVARRRHLRVHSGTPLREAPRLAVGWRADRFVFLPEGRAPYRLLVGSRSERRPDWPIADAIVALRRSKPADWRPVPARVGAGELLAGRKALDAPAAAFDWTRALLWGVLVLGAALVVGMAISLLRKPASPG